MLFKILVTFFPLLSLSRAFAAYKPEEYELTYTYSYTGRIATSINDPSFSSYFEISTDLQVKPFNDEMWLTLNNVTYKVYSGSSETDEAVAVPLPEDSQSITLPFIYHRYKDNSRRGITVHKDDKPWSRNIKQGIANNLFLDTIVFNVDEPTELQHEGYTYYSFPSPDERIVEKFMTLDYYDQMLQPKFKQYKEAYSTLPMVKKQKFIFSRTPYELPLVSMEYTCSFDFHPFNGASEKFNALVSQSLNLSSKIYSSDIAPVNMNDMEYVQIDFEPKMFMSATGEYDFTSGRQSIDMDAVAISVKNDLESLFKHLQESHITLTKSYLENKNHVDFLIQRLRSLDTAHLKELYLTIVNSGNQVMVTLLLQAMSLTGTSDPCFIIIDLISESALSEDASVQLLENMPKHMTQYYPKLVKRMWTLIEEKSTPEVVKNSAVISMSSILYWSKCKDKIIETLIDRLSNAKDDEEKVLFIHVLRNIRCQECDHALLKIAKNKSIIPHVRAMAMMSLKSDEHHSFLWLILFNKAEHFEVRAMALHLLTDPQYSKHYDKIFWYLSSDKNDDLKHLFLTKCKSLSTTTINRYAETSARAEALLPNMKWHSRKLFKGSNYLFDYLDSTFGFGAAALITYYGDFVKYNFTSVHIQFLEQSTSPIWSQSEYYFHIRWTSDEPRKFETFWNSGNHFMDCIFERMSIRNDDVVSFTSFQDSDHFSFDRWMDDLTGTNVLRSNLNQDFHTKIIIPTDIGVPLIFFNEKSQIKRTQVKLEEHFMFNLNYLGNEVYGFTTYNPITNTWNGIRRVHTTDVYIPIDINTDYRKRGLSITIDRGEETSGLQSYVYNQVFLCSGNYDDSSSSIIKASCPNCELSSVITEGDEFIQNHVLWESDGKNTGLDYKLAIFDCEDHITASHSKQLRQTIQTMLSNDDKNFESLPAVKPILALHRLWKSITLSPSTGMCGMGLIMKKSKTNPATRLHIDMDLKYTHGNTNVSDIHEYDWKIVYHMKNEDIMLKSWDVEFLYTKNKSTEYDLKLNAKSSMKNEPDYRFCLDVVDRWGHNQMTSDWTVVMGNDVDGNCPKNDSRLKISMTAGMNEDLKKIQNKIGTVFTACANNKQVKLRDCILDVTSYRSYNIDIEYENLTKKIIKLWSKISNFFKLTFIDELTPMEHEEESAKPGNIKIAVNYPYLYNSLNVSVVTPTESYRYDNVGYEYLKRLPYIQPYSTFSKYNNFLLEYCEAGKDYVRDMEEGDKYKLNYGDDGWSELIYNCKEEDVCQWKIKMKKSPEKDSSDVMLHIQVYKEVMELNYVGNDLEIHLNGEKISLATDEIYHYGEWIDYMVLRDREKSRALVYLKDAEINLYYDIDIVKMIMPVYRIVGQCRINIYDENTEILQ
ncbi:uncharacterized protein LOC143923134 [Arctopsyche grandis]|uniref:uncharacterized protein LOC143923134 n=1 Tax=Arctopsyche grandis TaxID=121162 RepID=UPI00406D927D